MTRSESIPIMKTYFLWAMAVIIPAGITFWFLWLVGKSVATMWQDWRETKELDELAEYGSRRRSEPTPEADANSGKPDPVDYTTRM